jgi:hypothetical protein
MMGRMMMMMMGMITAVMEAGQSWTGFLVAMESQTWMYRTRIGKLDEQLWRVIVRLKGAGEQRWQLM